MWLSDEAPKHSETCSLGKSLRLIREDWLFKYGIQPKAVVSFSDLEFDYQGIVYKAANFEDWGFATMARFADAGKKYSRTDEGYGVGHYTAKLEKHDAPRTSNTKRLWVFRWRL